MEDPPCSQASLFCNVFPPPPPISPHPLVKTPVGADVGRSFGMLRLLLSLCSTPGRWGGAMGQWGRGAAGGWGAMEPSEQSGGGFSPLSQQFSIFGVFSQFLQLGRKKKKKTGNAAGTEILPKSCFFSKVNFWPPEGRGRWGAYGGCSALFPLFQPLLEPKEQKWAGKKSRSAEYWISGTGRWGTGRDEEPRGWDGSHGCSGAQRGLGAGGKRSVVGPRWWVWGSAVSPSP